MKCNGCGNEHASKIHIYYITTELKERLKMEKCDSCGVVSSPYLPDVYFEHPYFDEHIADLKNPQGMWIESKSDKARKMKNLGLRESGDRVHGARSQL